MNEKENKAVIDNEVILEKLKNIENMLLQNAMYKKDILSVTEASAFLNLSPSFLYKLTCTNSLPFYKPNGKKIYFQKKDLENWVLQNRCMSNEEIDDKIDNMLSSQKHKYV